jgi:hypothetical protein
MRFLALLAVFLCLFAPWAARAQSRDPFRYPMTHYAAVLFMAMLGGFAGWYHKVRKGEIPGQSLFALVGEMATSSLAGLGAFFICDYFSVPIGVTAAVSGLCGYMGGRAIEMAERALLQRAERLAARDS